MHLLVLRVHERSVLSVLHRVGRLFLQSPDLLLQSSSQLIFTVLDCRLLAFLQVKALLLDCRPMWHLDLAADQVFRKELHHCSVTLLLQQGFCRFGLALTDQAQHLLHDITRKKATVAQYLLHDIDCIRWDPDCILWDP